MRVRALVVLLSISTIGLVVAGCAGNASPPPPASAPKIVSPPVSQTVTAGQSATFSVNATGAAPLSYQWNKNGAAIIGATSSSYVTPPTNPADNGAQFNVLVSNSSGSLATTAAILTVNSSPAITAQPSNQTVTAGQTATFNVAAVGSSPLSYQWNKNGTAISGANAATYTTPATTTIDSGAQFNVVVSNAFGNVASNPAALTVNPLAIAPAITSGISLTLVVGTAASFTVTSTGTPTPSLTEAGTLPGGMTFTDNGDGTATLAGTPAAGTGKAYSITFTASNGVGSPASQSFTLTVSVATFDGLGTVSGTSDSASLGSNPSSNTFSQSYSFSGGTSTPGRGTITAGGVTRSIFYIISKSKIVLMDVMNSGGTPNANPALVTGRQ